MGSNLQADPYNLVAVVITPLNLFVTQFPHRVSLIPDGDAITYLIVLS